MITNKDFVDIKKDLFIKMKMFDTTINGVKESEEYRLAQAYNEGIRDCIAILKTRVESEMKGEDK